MQNKVENVASTYKNQYKLCLLESFLEDWTPVQMDLAHCS
jgi:hypothetical protein